MNKTYTERSNSILRRTNLKKTYFYLRATTSRLSPFNVFHISIVYGFKFLIALCLRNQASRHDEALGCKKLCAAVHCVWVYEFFLKRGILGIMMCSTWKKKTS